MVRSLSEDFETYVLDLTARNRRMLWLMIAATLAAILAFAIFVWALVMRDLPWPLNSLLRSDPGNALNMASLAANFAVATALRIWYLRQDKMTTLLTHAMVLDGASDTAIRVLLNRKTK